MSGRLGSLLRVPVDYLLEIYEYGALSNMVALPNSPSAYSQARQSATSVAHALGTVVRELTPNHRTDISLRGVSGYAPRTGQTRNWVVSFLSGREILEEFDKFLDEYQTRASQKTSAVYMVFRALNEGYAYKVEPLEWKWAEDAEQNRFSYAWELQLEAYAGAPPSPLKSILSPVTEIVKAAQQYVALGAGAISLADNAIQNTQSELEEVRALVRSLERVSTALSNVANSVDGVTSFFTESLPASFASLSQSYRRAWDDALEAAGQRDSSYSNELIPYYALTTAGLVGVDQKDLDTADNAPLIVQERQGEASSAIPTYTRKYTLRAGDTLQTIALRAYGDASRFQDILAYNNMRDASTLENGRPLRPGDALQVPFDSGVEDDRGLARRGDVFGKDLRLTENYDLDLVGEDLATIDGVRNLKQAIKVRMLTEQGSAWPLPRYGVPALLGAGLTARVASFCAAHITDQLRADARVEDVRDVVVFAEGDALNVSATVSPLDGGTIQLTTPMRE